MEINHNNYEIFIIDYLDDKLDALQVAELLLFLENNPELKEEFDGLKEIKLTPVEGEVYGYNELLIQPSDKDATNIALNNYGHYFIASIENDLSSTGEQAVKNFITQHPELEKEYSLFASTKLKTDKKIRFPRPEDLKKKPKTVFLRYYMATGIAASLILIATIYFRLTPETDDAINRTLQNSIESQMNGEKSPATNNVNSEKGSNKINQDNDDKTKYKGNNTKNSTSKSEDNLKKSSLKKNQSNSDSRPMEAPLRKINSKSMIINNTPLMSQNVERNFYSGLYTDISLSQELALASAEDKEQIETEKQREAERIRGVKAGRIINSVISTSEQIAQQVPQSMNGWLIADLGIKGFNLLTNNNYSINRRLNSKGSIEELKIEESDNL